MSWLESKHRRSEEKAEQLQEEEIEKILIARKTLFKIVSAFEYDEHGLSKDIIYIDYHYLSEATGYSDYGTDTYRLAKENSSSGRILKLDIPITLPKNRGLLEYTGRIYTSDTFLDACSNSKILRSMIQVSDEYKYESCAMSDFSRVLTIFKIKETKDISAFKKLSTQDSPKLIGRPLTIISETCSSNASTFFLLVTQG